MSFVDLLIVCIIRLSLCPSLSDHYNEISSGSDNLLSAPTAWKKWRKNKKYNLLTSAPITKIRTKNEQEPDTALKREIIQLIYNHFKHSPTLFEEFAALIFQMHDEKIIVDEITRASADGGRDAIGRYQLGVSTDPIYIDFSLEAKCYRPADPKNKAVTVGVKEVSRLISRIRHRQLGVLITTSIISAQVYQEVREDEHPVIFICGRDISEILIDHGHNTVVAVKSLLKEYPV